MAGFAGVRWSELVRQYAEDQVLKWEDVDWQKQLITVRDEVAKQTSRKMGNRRFIPMEAGLAPFLDKPGARVLVEHNNRRVSELRWEPPKSVLNKSVMAPRRKGKVAFTCPALSGRMDREPLRTPKPTAVTDYSSKPALPLRAVSFAPRLTALMAPAPPGVC